MPCAHLVCQSHSSCPLPRTCPHCQGAVPKHVPLVPGCSLCSLGFKSPRGDAALLSLLPGDSQPQCPAGGSPCGGTMARQGGTSPISSKSHHSLHPLPVLPSPPAPTQPQPGPSSTAHCSLDRDPGGAEGSELGSGAEQLGPPRAELPRPGTALRGNKIFTRGHLAAAGPGAREPLLCQNTPVVPPGRGSCGGQGPHSPFFPHQGQPLQEDASGDSRSCRREILSPGTVPTNLLRSGLWFWTQQSGDPMRARVLARGAGVKSRRRGASSEMFCWRL